MLETLPLHLMGDNLRGPRVTGEGRFRNRISTTTQGDVGKTDQLRIFRIFKADAIGVLSDVEPLIIDSTLLEIVLTVRTCTTLPVMVPSVYLPSCGQMKVVTSVVEASAMKRDDPLPFTASCASL